MIAVIPARAGSKGIPGKNRRAIAGKPLVEWVIAAALQATSISRVIVATDDTAVMELAREAGAEVYERSAASATDEAPTEIVLREVVDHVGGGGFVLLQATSPMTRAVDIDGAVRVWESGFDSVVSVVPQTRFLWTRSEEGTAQAVNYDPARRPRRQEAQPLLVENGAIYVSSGDVLGEYGARLGGRVGLYEMDPATYYEIDDDHDWVVVEQMLSRQVRPDAGDLLSRVELVLTDVDGVLTDNGMYWSSDGAELKRFSARDGKGFERLHQRGISTALITSESQELVVRRGAKLGCLAVELGCRDKVAAADVLRQRLGLEWEQIAFVGDDIHDLGLLEQAGTGFAPRNAVPAVLARADHILSTDGGAGCFREAADLILTAKGYELV